MSDSLFQVKVGDLKLPAEVEKRIAIRIREVVLQEIAALDLKQPIAVQPGFRFDKSWLGIWLDTFRPKPGGPGRPGGPGPGPGPIG